ncbi:MAG: ribonuclease D [Ilumatobacteraceae bacterium]
MRPTRPSGSRSSWPSSTRPASPTPRREPGPGDRARLRGRRGGAHRWCQPPDGCRQGLRRGRGTSLVRRVAAALAAGGCRPVFAVGGDLVRLRAAGLEAVRDGWPGEGPLGGIVTAVRHAGVPTVVVRDRPRRPRCADGRRPGTPRRSVDLDAVVRAPTDSNRCARCGGRAPSRRSRPTSPPARRAVHAALPGLRLEVEQVRPARSRARTPPRSGPFHQVTCLRMSNHRSIPRSTRRCRPGAVEVAVRDPSLDRHPGRVRGGRRHAERCRALAIDTEFHRERTCFPKLALVQLGWDDQIVLVDPIAVDVTPLRRLFASPAVAVFHAAQQDLDVLTHSVGSVPARMFDTQLAAGFTGYSTPSLQSLLHAELGVNASKGDRLTDWLRRPLTADQQGARPATWLICSNCTIGSPRSSPRSDGSPGRRTPAKSCGPVPPVRSTPSRRGCG